MIRAATFDDVPQISDIRTRSWRFIYRGFMPDTRLDDMDARESDERWRVMIDGTTPRARIFVDESGDAVTGFIALEPANAGHFGYEAYLSALYIEPDTMGKGSGRALFEKGCAWMREVGYASVFWWVIAANWRAIAFYEKMGAARVPNAVRECHGDGMLEYGFGFDLAGDLAGRR